MNASEFQWPSKLLLQKLEAAGPDLEPGVYIHEGSELMYQLRDGLMILLDISDLTPECDISKADTTPTEEELLRGTIERHCKIFLGNENAAPAPVRGAVCDIDGSGAKPIAIRPRSIIPKVAMKVYEPLKKTY
ncbi:reverse transcriptase [Phytophthora megakarya]|uniref:Reverse transcriptase n=1 Tax=Phytophthora megakarya TaxID=4795 RepID=A0A225UR44_9STRA|nr:reverse transcriptase [Phytophthora megakarya]